MVASADRLVIRRTFAARRELVFAAFTAPEHVMKWWGPRGHTAFSCEMDAHPGGDWRVGMRSPEGVEIWAHGQFRELVPPSRLVMSFEFEEPSDGLGGETVVTIELTARGGATEMLLQHASFATIDSRDRHQVGWDDSLDRLAEELGPAPSDA